MRYTQLAAIPAFLAVLSAAAPQVVENVIVKGNDVETVGPAHPTDLVEQAVRVLSFMDAQKPNKPSTKTVTGPAAVVQTKTILKTTPKKPAPKTTTKKPVKKPVKKPGKKKFRKVVKRAATSSTIMLRNSPATSSSSAVSSSSTAPGNVNTACAVQPIYQPWNPSNNTAAGFLVDSTIASTSGNAAAPAGYVWTFSQYAYSINTRGFLGVYELPSYNVSACAAQCSGTPYCYGFNIFYERDPTLAPAALCMTPDPLTNIKCTLWDSRLSTSNLVNYGEWRMNFAVLIAGSNGYSLP